MLLITSYNGNRTGQCSKSIAKPSKKEELHGSSLRAASSIIHACSGTSPGVKEPRRGAEEFENSCKNTDE